MRTILLIPFFILTSNQVFANTLECSRVKGIKKCQEEAKEFCDEENFNLKSTNDSYIVSCIGTATEGVVKENKDLPVKQVRPPKFWRFAAGVGYNGGAAAEADLKITNVNTLATATGTAEFDVESGITLSFEGRFLRENAWGLTLGVDYDLKRDVESGSITLGGETVTVSGSSDPDEITTLVLYGNAVYMWDKFYIPFGFNVSFSDYKSTGLDVNSTPAIGAQLGVGFQANDNFTFELFSRALGFELDYRDGNLDVLFEEGMRTDFILRAKYIF